MIKTHIIIVTYNAMKWAEKCFSSLRKSTIPVKTIVVDNGSKDGTQEYIQKNFPEVDFIQSPENLGFGKANNLGIEKAYKQGADFFYLMNQDAWIFENTFEEMLKVYDSYENKDEIGIISPMHLDGSEKNFDLHFERYLSKCTEKNRLFSDLYTGTFQSYYEIDFVNAAHWLLPKETIEKVGGFNPFFFYGAEDYDYINRLKFFSKKIIVATQSKVVHDAYQGFVKPYHTDAEKARQESLRMQRETRYLDLNYPLDIQREKKEFLNNIIKLRLKGHSKESKFYAEMRTYFNSKFEEILRLRSIAQNNNHAFLEL